MPEVQDEREGIPPRMDVVAPPSVGQPQTNSGGSGGFISQGGAITPNWSLQQSQAYSKQLAAQDAAKADRIAQLQDQVYLEQVRQSAGVEDAIKATAAARKFIAQRRFGRDLSVARASGLPDDQALAHALTKNAVDLFGDHPEHIPAMLKAVTPPGQTHMVPASGGMPAYLVDPRGTPHFAPKPPVDKGEVTPANRIAALHARATILLDQLKNEPLAPTGHPEKKAAFDPIRAELTQVIEELKGVGQTPQATALVQEDVAQPLPKSKAELKKDGIYHTKKGKARWTGEQFESIQ